MTKHIDSTAQAKAALKRLVTADGKVRDELLTYGVYIAEQTLIHGNKQPFQMAESSGLAKWAVAALKRCIVKQNIEYRDDKDGACKVATEHAERVFSMVLDKKQDDSEQAKKRRADAQAKRKAEKQRITDLEAENVRLKANAAKTPSKGSTSGANMKGGALVAPDGKIAVTLTESEYKAAIAYIKAQRKPAPKAVEPTQQAATA